MIVLRYAKFVFEADQARFDHLRDVYLAEWAQYGTLDALRAAFDLAAQIAAFCRALTWLHIARSVAEEFKAEVADSTPYWMLRAMKNDLWAS